MTYPAVLRTFQKSVAIVTSLPLSVSVGVCALVSFAYINLLLSFKKFPLHRQEQALLVKLWNYSHICLHLTSVTVVVSWGMGVFVNRTSQFFVRHGQNPSMRILQDSESNVTRQHYLWLKDMFGYSLCSMCYFGLLERTMIAFLNLFDTKFSSSSIGASVCIHYLVVMALWLLGLYIFSPCMVAAPLIVLERKSLRLALSKSSKLLKALSSDSVSWFSGQQCHLIKLVAFLSLGIVVLDWITRISFTNIASNYEAQMHLFPSHVFRSIALGLVHVVAFLPLYST